jgi:tol-pal system protein YbgF
LQPSNAGLSIAFLLALLLTACSSGSAKDELNLPPPPVSDYPSPQQQAANDARLNELQTSMTELLERLDVMNDRLAKMEAAQADLSSTSERRVTERTVEVTPTPAAPVAMPTTSAPAVPAPAPAPVLTSRTTAPARADIYMLYRNALVLYGKNRWADSRNVFQQVFDAEPTGELADNALYWIGETYFAAADYANAMRFYGRVTKDFANENKAPDAMFKMGVSYAKTGDLGMARKTLEETMKKYPYATAAASAKAELSRIRY